LRVAARARLLLRQQEINNRTQTARWQSARAAEPTAKPERRAPQRRTR